MVPRFLSHNDFTNVRSEFVIGSTAKHAAVEVMVGLREETRADFAVGGETDAAAVAAEWARDRGDDSNLAATIVEGEATGGLAGSVLWKLHEGTESIEALD